MSDVGYSKLITERDFKGEDEARGGKAGTGGGGDLEVRPSQNRSRRQYQRRLLTNAQKSFVFLEYQSLVDFVEADAEYVISAGRDHDINVWDAVEGKHLRRFTGHAGPVTGLHLAPRPSVERVVVSASEDGDIRRWSISKGFVGKIETDNVITCMGIINNTLAVTGNNKGYMEVRHLDTGELYSSILAHEDPIEALTVCGKYACSAVFDYPSSLKVWEIQFEQTACVYRIENPADVEFRSLALWNTTLILGTSSPSLQAVDFKSGEKRDIDLMAGADVQHVRVWNEWILSCCTDDGSVLLDVHRIHNFEYFGTFNCNMKQVSATAAVEFDNSLKIILGGSSLAILSFDFILTQDVIISHKSTKHNSEQSKNKSHYTLKSNMEDYDETSTDSEDDNCDKSISHCDKNILPQRYPPVGELLSNIWGSEDQPEMNPKDRNKETAEEVQMTIGSASPLCTTDHWSLLPEKDNKEIRQAQMSVQPVLAHCTKDVQLWPSGIIGYMETSFQTYAEPRVAARQLRQPELDGPSERSEENRPHSRYFGTLEEAREALLKEMRDNLKIEKSEDAKEDKLDGSTKDEANRGDTKESNIGEIEKENPHIQSEKVKAAITEKLGLKNRMADDKVMTLEHSKKFSCRKKEKCKSGKKKTTEKNPHKRCQIM